MKLRRSVLFLAIKIWSCIAGAAESTLHALTLAEQPKYPPSFSHFSYVNPRAPKGGTLRKVAVGSFDSFNPFLAKGISAAIGDVYESLGTNAADDYYTIYPLIAESFTVEDSGQWFQANLNPLARWSDGVPITPEDVVFSFNALREKGSPSFRLDYLKISRVEIVGKQSVRFYFKQPDKKLLPYNLAGMPVLPKHYFKTVEEFAEVNLRPPMGSGPYRLLDYRSSLQLVLERDKNYWGKDLPVRVGQENFDRIVTDYFRDVSVAREYVMSGAADFLSEGNLLAWAAAARALPVQRGFLLRKKLRLWGSFGAGGMVFNLNRSLFQDVRIREALSLLLDFKTVQRLYSPEKQVRRESYFMNTDIYAPGKLPDDAELRLLNPLRGRVPERVFTEPMAYHQSAGNGFDREGKRRALELLREAGWWPGGSPLALRWHGEGEVFHFTFTTQMSGGSQKTLGLFSETLRKVGIEMRIYLVDSSILTEMVRARDFDMTWGSWFTTDFPAEELESFFGTESANLKASANVGSVRDPAVDYLVSAVKSAQSRPEQIAAARALDRVLFWNHYAILGWYDDTTRWYQSSRIRLPLWQDNELFFNPLSPAWSVEAEEKNTADR